MHHYQGVKCRDTGNMLYESRVSSVRQSLCESGAVRALWRRTSAVCPECDGEGGQGCP